MPKNVFIELNSYSTKLNTDVTEQKKDQPGEIGVLRCFFLMFANWFSPQILLNEMLWHFCNFSNQPLSILSDVLDQIL